MSSSHRTRNLVLLAAGLFLTLVAAIALVYRAPPASGPGGPSAGAQAALLQSREALRGAPAAFDALPETIRRVPQTIDGTSAAALAQLKAGATTISKARKDVLAAHRILGELDKLTPILAREIEQLQFAASSEQNVTAQLKRMSTIADSITPSVRSLVLGPGRPTDIANRLGQAEIEVEQIILGLQGGDADLDLEALSGARVVEALGRLAAARDKVFTQVRDARALADRLDLVHQASRQLDSVSPQVLAGIAAQGGAAGGNALILGLLVAAALMLTAMAWFYSQSPPVERVVATAPSLEADRNQQAILRLLDELSSLADGDLTVQATVTEDITGAIADSINYAIEALRELVTTINESAILLDGAARTAESTAAQLAQASESQSKHVESASHAIGRMVGSIKEVSGDAERSADVARHSVDVAHKGGEAVRRTIAGMNAIRETIQDTSKRIKRLGESSQEIGNIVELINDIADQTNILALNASIQASMAGEAGRGFAVVADEVQRLAERSTNATKQIEVLVRTIQADTNEAIVSMERSTTDVVGGALLAENAGAALEEIEQVSSQIASLVQNISSSAREQAAAAAAVIRVVELLQQINTQTASGTSTTRDSITKLAELASQLRRSVTGFRLPAGDAESRRARGSESTPESATPAAAPQERSLKVVVKKSA
ncbi:MAG: methyl-accepting chemotaxis protein [Gammaproteobacteria bacterium]|nr:methyl-accepting chemotaxis protein [Gammaproteobacteria bacterium]